MAGASVPGGRLFRISGGRRALVRPGEQEEGGEDHDHAGGDQHVDLLQRAEQGQRRAESAKDDVEGSHSSSSWIALPTTPTSRRQTPRRTLGRVKRVAAATLVLG